MKFLYETNDKATKAWECPKCRKWKCNKITGKCEPLIWEHKPEDVRPDYETVQTAKGES